MENNNFEIYKNKFINLLVESGNENLDFDYINKASNYMELWENLYNQIIYLQIDLMKLDFNSEVINNTAFKNYFRLKFINILHIQFLGMDNFCKQEDENELLNRINYLYKDSYFGRLLEDNFIHNLSAYHVKKSINEYLDFNC